VICSTGSKFGPSVLTAHILIALCLFQFLGLPLVSIAEDYESKDDDAGDFTVCPYDLYNEGKKYTNKAGRLKKQKGSSMPGDFAVSPSEITRQGEKVLKENEARQAEAKQSNDQVQVESSSSASQAQTGSSVNSEPNSVGSSKIKPSSLPSQITQPQNTVNSNTSVGNNSKNQVQPKVTASSPAPKPTLLFGRIEEISSGKGATLPLKIKLKAGVPQMDNSYDLKGSAKQHSMKANAGVTIRSFPADFQGVWQGTLTISSSEYSTLRFQFDGAEARKEQELTARGTKGNVRFDFRKDAYGNISLQPAQVVFTTTMDRSQYANMFNQVMANQTTANMINEMMQSMGASGIDPGQAQAMLGSQQILSSVPYMYSINLGDIVGGVGVTGNSLNSRVLKNEVKRLANNSIEQVIVTYDRVQNPKTGKVRDSYSESVLRFFKQNNNQLYVQAASVGYNQQGQFEDKIVMYGTVYKAR
jgi:hypothetical protein